MKGKTVAITGCSRGLGFVTAKTCAAKGARVLMLNRESPRAREALAEVAAAATGPGPPVETPSTGEETTAKNTLLGACNEMGVVRTMRTIRKALEECF